jgi:hypothetical protein
MKKEQFETITKWQEKTFGAQDATGAVNHLKEEVEELLIAIAFAEDTMHLEIADCFILLFGIAKKQGMDYDAICDAIDEKHQINVGRKWGQSEKNGSIKHIK